MTRIGILCRKSGNQQHDRDVGFPGQNLTDGQGPQETEDMEKWTDEMFGKTRLS